ncbi:hypothetical protein [Halorubrum distributum]|uniref:hypothetical protein n=1 Tax=Halorubrum distributum TaxID=29283 RepID=UPI00126763CF|nr:hypothetical protein [Halorubrum litoreum]
MLDSFDVRYEDIVVALKRLYFSLLPLLIYTTIGVILEIVDIVVFPDGASVANLMLYYFMAVPHRILFISLISVVLIKSISISKAGLLHIWRRYTPPFDPTVKILQEPRSTADLIQTARKRGFWALGIGFAIGVSIPLTGEIPLQYGSISFGELPDLPYAETLSELVSGFPIVGDLLVLSLISVRSTILYIPISISAFIMIIGIWNLSYYSRNYLYVSRESDETKCGLIFKLLATANAVVATVYLYLVLLVG